MFKKIVLALALLAVMGTATVYAGDCCVKGGECCIKNENCCG